MKKLDVQQLLDKAQELLGIAKRYAPLLFCAFMALTYGFVIYRIQLLNISEPSQSDITAKSRTASVPHINPVVLQQLQNLQDNSVSAQTLFNSSRSNPFQE
ncbi:MAG: hypothetical protein ACREGB_00125 [Candidatus Saccharimonadales bacterium]